MSGGNKPHLLFHRQQSFNAALPLRGANGLTPSRHAIRVHIDHLNDDPLPLDLWAGHRISARIGGVATARGEALSVRR